MQVPKLPCRMPANRAAAAAACSRWMWLAVWELLRVCSRHSQRPAPPYSPTIAARSQTYAETHLDLHWTTWIQLDPFCAPQPQPCPSWTSTCTRWVVVCVELIGNGVEMCRLAGRHVYGGWVCWQAGMCVVGGSAGRQACVWWLGLQASGQAGRLSAMQTALEGLGVQGLGPQDFILPHVCIMPLPLTCPLNPPPSSPHHTRP